MTKPKAKKPKKPKQPQVHEEDMSQKIPESQQSRQNIQTIDVRETLRMDDSVGKLLDKQFQPAAMLLGGLITVVVFVASGLFWFDGTIRTKVHDSMQNELTLLHTRDDEISRGVGGHEERIKKLESLVGDTQQVLAVMRQVQEGMREDVKDIKEFMRRNGANTRSRNGDR
jgi:hypothetical protein